MKKFIVALFVSALALAAQTTAPAPAATAATTYPSYFISFGGGYTRGAALPAEGFISAAIGLGGGNYSITTVDNFATGSSVRTGFAKIMSQSGNFTLLARVDAGVSTVAPVIGNFSGGAVVMYQLKGISSKLANTYAFVEARITGASSSTAAQPSQVFPGFFLGVGKSF
jgi:hypothetical protein